MTMRTNRLNQLHLKIIALSLLISAGFLGQGCDSGSAMDDDPIPYLIFDEIVINLSLPAYADLKSDGGYVYMEGGVRGLIVYRESATSYIVFERNCSYHPNDACATVDVHVSTLYMVDACCKSTFSFPAGEPNGGPAWRPLRQYRTYLAGSELTITDEIL